MMLTVNLAQVLLALQQLPQHHLHVKMVRAWCQLGVAHHRGESAIAIKASRNSDNGHWSSNVNGAADTRGQWTVGAGVGYEW